ncbi:MAG TPA: hypothetical protein ENK57_20185 [Polyangiaceae bacterium]|nr:hypothetical protein [Polyangiaceae bacterium]
MIVTDPTARKVLEALLEASDGDALLQAIAPAERPASAPAPAVPDSAVAMQKRFGMVDILDDSILDARQGDSAFPLRLLFSELTEHGGEDVAFAFACGINMYFRANMGEEARVRVGLEVSRLYYQFAREALDDKLRRAASPLLAQLMTTQLETLELRHVDEGAMFDSALHERAPGADATSPRIKRPVTFLCRVAGTQRARIKAAVTT